MRIETFFEARDLYDKYQLCEEVMKYLSDEESVKGQKYLETLRQFTDAFKMEFMTFVHERMEAVGMQFESLHCPEHSEQPDTPEPPTEDLKEPKFPIGSKVEVIEGIGKGGVGVVKDYNPTASRYYVVSDNFSMWFAEAELKSYTEESEDTTMKFKEGDIVKILLGEMEGRLARVVYCDYKDKTYRVEPIDIGFVGDLWYSEHSLELYVEPENPEEDGAGDTDPTEGE